MDQIHERQTVTKWPWPRYNNQVKPITYRKRISIMKSKVWKLVGASFAVLLLAVAVYMVFFAAPRAMGSLVLQVNPGFNFTFDERNIVIEAKGTDAAGEELLAGLDVIGKEVTEANLVITRAMHEAGLLADGDLILIALYPFGDQNGEIEAQLTALAGAIYQTQTEYLAKHGLLVDVVSVALSAELADGVDTIVEALIDLHEDGATPENIMSVFNLLEGQVAAGVNPTLLLEEITTITAAKIDLLEAGITGDNSLAILEGALAADPEIEELATITAAMIDLHQAGATPENIMAVFILVEEQIAAGVERTLLLEEFTTITAAKVDMLDAGITGGNSMAILREALKADPTLEELATITAAMIDLHQAGATPENIMAVFKLLEEQVAAGLDRNLLLEEFTTITAAKIDMLDAGITEDQALDILKSSLAADPTLEELTTITAAMIDLIEQGLSTEEALARIQAAIEADPTLEKFDDLFESDENEDENEPDLADAPGPDEEVDAEN
jgi:Fe2+ transport system protein FeoA